MSFYEPLRRHLAATSAPRVTLSYEEMERLLGRRLPRSARSDHRRQWWANTDSHSQARAWLSVGRKAKPVGPELVEFYTTAPESPERGVATVRIARLAPATRRAIADLAEENRLSASEAVEALLDRHCLEERRAQLAWFQSRSKFSPTPSADLIRADRDGR